MHNPFEFFPQNDANDSDIPGTTIRGNCPLCMGNKTASLFQIKVYLKNNPTEAQALSINGEADLKLISGDVNTPHSEWIYLCPKCNGEGFVV